ncbi:hypothetical protein D3C72_487180 [compost metagenome]
MGTDLIQWDILMARALGVQVQQTFQALIERHSWAECSLAFSGYPEGTLLAMMTRGDWVCCMETYGTTDLTFVTCDHNDQPMERRHWDNQALPLPLIQGFMRTMSPWSGPTGVTYIEGERGYFEVVSITEVRLQILNHDGDAHSSYISRWAGEGRLFEAAALEIQREVKRHFFW